MPTTSAGHGATIGIGCIITDDAAVPHDYRLSDKAANQALECRHLYTKVHQVQHDALPHIDARM